MFLGLLRCCRQGISRSRHGLPLCRVHDMATSRGHETPQDCLSALSLGLVLCGWCVPTESVFAPAAVELLWYVRVCAAAFPPHMSEQAAVLCMCVLKACATSSLRLRSASPDEFDWVRGSVPALCAQHDRRGRPRLGHGTDREGEAPSLTSRLGAFWRRLLLRWRMDAVCSRACLGRNSSKTVLPAHPRVFR